MGLVVVASLGAIQSLTESSEREVANEMDCVSTRPPPASCQIRSATTTTTDPSATTSSTEPPPTTESTTTTELPPPPQPTEMAWTGLAVTEGSTWRADAQVALDVDGEPVVDAVVRVRVIITAPPLPFTYEVTCTTASDGTCTASFTAPTDLGLDVTRVRFTVHDVENVEHPVEDPPNDLLFTKP